MLQKDQEITTHFFFTFLGKSPFKNLYVEVEVKAVEETTYGEEVTPYAAARIAMFDVFGSLWAFQYRIEQLQKQREEFGLRRLCKITLNWPNDPKVEVGEEEIENV